MTSYQIRKWIDSATALLYAHKEETFQTRNETHEDVDILIESSAENVTRLINELRNFGDGHARKLTPADFSESEGAIRIIEDFPLDVFTMMRGKRYADLVGSTKPTRIDDVDVRYLDAEALIALKSNSQRDQDRIDVSALRSLQNRPST